MGKGYEVASDCFRSRFITMRTARISDLRRGHLTGGFVAYLRVRSLSHERLGGLHQRCDRAAQAGPTVRPSLYICAVHALGFCPRVTSCCIETMIAFRPTPPRTPVACP